MTGDEWKKMERVIPVAPWTNLDMSRDKRRTTKNETEGEKENENK